MERQMGQGMQQNWGKQAETGPGLPKQPVVRRVPKTFDAHDRICVKGRPHAKHAIPYGPTTNVDRGETNPATIAAITTFGYAVRVVVRRRRAKQCLGLCRTLLHVACVRIAMLQ